MTDLIDELILHERGEWPDLDRDDEAGSAVDASDGGDDTDGLADLPDGYVVSEEELQ